MKRILTVLFTAVVLAWSGGVAQAAPPPAEQQLPPTLNCLTRTSTPSSPGSWFFVSSAGWWRLGPLAATPSCNGYVSYASRGWRLDGTQCGQVWVRRPLPGGGTYIVPGSVKHICGGQTTVVVSSCGCQRFWVEAWPYATVDRHAGYWNVGTTRF